MKFFTASTAITVNQLVISSLLSMPASVEAVKCGKWYSTECKAKTDVRYDAEYTNNIKEQNPVWVHYEGYWKRKVLAFDESFAPSQPQVFNPVDTRKSRGLPYKRDIFDGLLNFTMDGSRLTESIFNVYSPAPEWFCNQTDLEPGDLTVFGDGVCGETGYASYAQNFYTSSHEKDGTLELVGGLNGALREDGFTDIAFGSKYGIGDDVIYSSSSYEVGGGINGFTTTQTFTNKAKTTAALTVDTWNKANDVAILIATRRATYEKITEEEFLSEIVRLWDENQIKADERPLPSAGPCLSSICATEENWCKFDPNCSVSPYQEPEGKLKNSFVAGLISICALVIFLVAYVYHRKLVSDEAKRVRILVATRIAEHLNVTFNSKKLTKEALSQQFQSIDSSGDGVLQKDEIKEFFMDSKHAGGSITESDFESIFAALDSDGNGEIDFVEFVAFLNQCKSDTFEDENDA